MESNSDFGSIAFDLPKNQSNVIKVIGVGGGGSNAINHMFRQGIKGVDFIVCNTDSQALQNSPVPNKIQLGVTLTEGLGAGANPEIGQQAAIESVNEIEKMLDSNTKMVFITAGMGGGTGTGAAPVIAKLSKERDILTVGIVTIPFQFEGKVRHEQALAGVERLRKQVDSLIVINNNKLREVYGNLGFKAGFSKADEVLATASRGIAEVITHHYTQNIDLKDAKTVLSNSGTAIMGSATTSGENRAKEAIINALDSPLLNDNKITGAKNVLLLIVSGTDEITMDEIGEINEHIQAEAGGNANIIMGVGDDEKLGEAISVTIIATGFNADQQSEIVNTAPNRIIHTLEDEQKLTQQLTPGYVLPTPVIETPVVAESKVVFNLDDELVEEPIKDVTAAVEFTPEIVTPAAPVVETPQSDLLIATTEFIRNIDVTFEIVSPLAEQDFFFTPTQVVTEKPVASVEKEQISLSFDLPLTQPEKTEAPTLLFDLPQETKEIKVVEALEVVPVTDVTSNGVIVHSLEEYMEFENSLLQSQPQAKVEEQIPAELNITLKQVETPAASIQTPTVTSHSAPVDINPTDMSLEEVNRLKAEERRRKLKEFNYKFHSNSARIDELEREPAYKRSGIDLTQGPNTNSASRTSLGIDSNNDIQLRSNNSFLHDNVD
ncbi:cell division protein FtsZ [Flavobacterium aurantiibacter]|uniref:Cell division protein FtsZ n=1 Tax=Flavobacterium aurantiibacter TaxID=2023067 RepID=A0A255ZUQ4_9FLAO|nr:cell division protein FtsZ [Flavobacterium aurantiibacter]OYQ45257.1 cell division protein FtsZ [Flavobacterium aurantiibacter]